jgi:lysophospholipase L1-like esterase
VKPTTRFSVVSGDHGKFSSTIGPAVFRGSSILLLAVALCCLPATDKTALAQVRQSGMHWIGIWTTPPTAQPSGQQTPVTAALPLGPRPSGAPPPEPQLPPIGFNNQTVRVIVRTTMGARQVRVRLSNAYGMRPLAIGAAHIALRSEGAGIKPDTDRTVTFGGTKSTTIWTGAFAVSDPVDLDVPALADLAVSIYLPGDVPASFPITYHGLARQTNYISSTGDFTSSKDMPVSTTRNSWYFLSGVEAMVPEQVGAVVAFGDSLTDANISTPNTNSRWPDELARRLVAAHQSMGVMNEGTGGNRILHDGVAGSNDNGLHRFDRDVLSQPGITHVIVFLGINDIRNRNPNEAVTADEMIAGYKQLILRAHARGVKIFGATLLPNENETAYTPEGEVKREAVNAWIRTSGAFDGVVDFEKALRDPSHPTSMLPKYDCGDHLHPNDLGYKTLGDAIDLAMLK